MTLVLNNPAQDWKLAKLYFNTGVSGISNGTSASQANKIVVFYSSDQNVFNFRFAPLGSKAQKYFQFQFYSKSVTLRTAEFINCI